MLFLPQNVIELLLILTNDLDFGIIMTELYIKN
jgi:hypothetical protein